MHWDSTACGRPDNLRIFDKNTLKILQISRRLIQDFMLWSSAKRNLLCEIKVKLLSNSKLCTYKLCPVSALKAPETPRIVFYANPNDIKSTDADVGEIYFPFCFSSHSSVPSSASTPPFFLLVALLPLVFGNNINLPLEVLQDAVVFCC